MPFKFGVIMLVISFSFTVEPCIMVVPSASKLKLEAEFKLQMFRSLRMKVLHWHREMAPLATVLRET